MADFTHDDYRYLDEPDEHGDAPRVEEWDDGKGILIDSPGCGTAQLTNEQVENLRIWLNEREHARKVEASVDYNYKGELYHADPNCKHEVVSQWSGVKCRKCAGWFCL